MKFYFSLLIAVSLLLAKPIKSLADEGMWIPMLLEQLNEQEMQEMGMRITARDIYDINKNSLKDAIFLFGGGCTSSVISDQGLLLTNHHCGYRTIQQHSTVENNLLSNGFWAASLDEELPNPGLTASRLVRMQDVTDKILDGVDDNMSERRRASIIRQNSDKLTAETKEGTHYDAFVRPFFQGNEFYLFVTETFTDVRLVGAPPRSIGGFGGDTDNWMWPRHTGDFALYRIYAGADNLPAEYSPDNVPYRPKYTIPVSLDGITESDFTFIYGFPGTTRQYLPSHAIQMITQKINPAGIKLRGKKIDIYQSFMNEDEAIRLQYAAKLKSVSNAWKRWKGENNGIRKLNGIQKKQDYEAAITEWINASPERANMYGGILPAFAENYAELSGFQLERTYMLEAGLSNEIVRAARSLTSLNNLLQKEGYTDDELTAELEKARSALQNFYKDYHQPLDREVLAAMLKAYRQGIDGYRLPPVFDLIDRRFKGDVDRYADWLFGRSMFAVEEDALAFVENFRTRHAKRLRKDPAFELASGLLKHYRQEILPELSRINNSNDSLMRLYVRANMEFEPDRRFYPDANLTLRVSYGNVKPYYPRDAVFYHYQTSLTGVMEKDDPAILDYKVEEKLKALYQAKDFGRYGQGDTMPVCFIGNNHTTGGNSGSPAFNADGHLIGLNFDRVWEGTMSDLMFDPDQCRNIMVDIRYCLFIIDKFAGAERLIREIRFAN